MPRHPRSSLLLLALGVLLLSPLLAQEDPRAELKKKLDAAIEAFDRAEAAYDDILAEVEHDFGVVRGEHWVKIAPGYEEAILAEAALLRKEPKHDLAAGLRERFRNISVVCGVTNGRLVRAIAAPIREAAGRDGEVDAAGILAAGLEAVFPEETFEECWDEHFMDLPQIARYDEAEAALEKARAAYEAPLRPKLPECDGPEGTVLVPKGRFVYGPWTGWQYDLEGNKSTKASSAAFYLDGFEVTNEEFRAFLSGLGSARRVKEYLPDDFRVREGGEISIPEGAGARPVTGITLAAATAYAASLGKRLPTEEEWEYAARGADGRPYPWGTGFEAGFANCRERGLGRKADVGSHPKDRSPFGAYDLAGNVSELTATLAGRKPAGGKPGPTDAVVWRGGSYEKDREAARTTYRWTLLAAKGRSPSVGFRCVVSVKDWKRKAGK